MSKTLFKNYIWLVDTIYRAGHISFEAINSKWMMSQLSDGKPIPLRTFHNWRQKVEEVFDINIECNKSTNEYFIENAEELNSNSVKAWLLNSFTVSNLILESSDIKKHISLENVPSGQKFLNIILESIKENVQLQVEYKSYHEQKSTKFLLSPYFIKLFKQRWYLIAESDKIRIYGLDRFLSIVKTDKNFQFSKNLEVESYFADCYGITNDKDLKPEIIRLKVSTFQANYIRDLPLHHSQKEIEENKAFVIFEYFLKPTFDFLQEILKYGNRVELIYPTHLRDELSTMIVDALQPYLT